MMIGQTLSHYRIIEKIGAGGMGEVYKARDEHLDRDAAIKVLPKGTLTDEKARKRFRKEALALSKLSHPNIATVFDFDTQEGVDFLVMEFVEGTTLAVKLKTGALLKKEVTSLGAQIAEALEEAHERGVVHRDLKPGNIAVTPKDRVKVLDFGLARLVRPVSDEATTAAMTEELTVAGTLPYMSPEELRGERADHRSDLYSFGVVLYEMATGRRPFEHTLSTALADAIIHKPPEPPSTHNRQVSPGLDNIIIKALDKNPEHRYQSAREMRVDLERLSTPTRLAIPTRKKSSARPWMWAVAGLVVVLAVLAAMNVGGLRDMLIGEPGLPSINSIAVLPLENLSRDPEQEYFADGMTEALITDIGKIGALKVISRTSVMRYKDTHKLLPEIAHELNVDAVVEASVLHAGQRVRITATLVEAATDTQLWTESYERDMRDILALQGEVARSIAREIEVAVTAEEETRLARIRPVNPDAYEAYFKGRYHSNRFNPADLTQAIDYFRQAIDADPDFASPYAYLADSFLLATGAIDPLFPSLEAMQKAKTLAQKALEFDPELSEAYSALGRVLAGYEWDWTAAEKALKQAIVLNPGSAQARRFFAIYLSQMGRHQEALAEIKRALDLDPLNLREKAVLGMLLYVARQYDEAIQQLKTVLALDPNHALAHRMLGLSYMQKKMYDEAIAEHQEAVALTGGSSITNLSFLGGAYAAGGKRAEARRTLQELEQRSAEGQYVDAHARFHIHLMLGDEDQALSWLESSINQHDSMVQWIKVVPWSEPLRSDPRFQDLLQRMNFPE